MMAYEDYPIDQWAADFKRLGELSKLGSPHEHTVTGGQKPFHDYLYQEYADDPHGEEKTRRVLAAYNYLIQHREELNHGKSAVFGATSGIIRAPIVEAMHRLFMTVPLVAIDDNHPISVVHDIIRQQEE